MNKDQIVSIFIVSAFTSLFVSDKLFVANVVIFFLVLVYYLNKNDDDEFDDLDED